MNASAQSIDDLSKTDIKNNGKNQEKSCSGRIVGSIEKTPFFEKTEDGQ